MIVGVAESGSERIEVRTTSSMEALAGAEIINEARKRL